MDFVRLIVSRMQIRHAFAKFNTVSSILKDEYTIKTPTNSLI